jgi:hypothetical protein
LIRAEDKCDHSPAKRICGSSARIFAAEWFFRCEIKWRTATGSSGHPQQLVIDRVSVRRDLKRLARGQIRCVPTD